MGGWKLEVFKMAMYMTFPIGLFYYFNQPEFFESWMIEKRAELFRHEDPSAKSSIVKAASRLDRMREKQIEEQMKKAS
ncbi:protein PET100 homolog, mitochondrial-like isoform X2 [Tubulanus polymorphus]|uniref:protein PET100 homolog, mitochondrial-like isoform X2 n=1 Tax=Tubulanus polymorphus TaxID=672921 RepID=UPI003DA62C05